MIRMRPDLRAILCREDVRAIEHFAMHTLDLSGAELMQRAAQAAFDALRERWPHARGVAVLCGAGNNAGDGYLLAHAISTAGLAVWVGAVCDPARLKAEARAAYQRFIESGGAVLPWRDALAAPADVCVDAMLGIGADRELDGDLAAAVEALNSRQDAVLALDLPAGIDADTGALLGRAVSASMTVTFIAHKLGLWVGHGPNHTGEIKLADLHLPQWPPLRASSVRALDPLELRPALRPRTRGANKGDFGRVLIVGGGAGMAGAVQLAGESCLRSGAGLVTLAMSPESIGHISVSIPELMVWTPADAAELMPLAQRADVIAIGPGLGQSAWARGMWSCVMASGKPLIVDADALNLLAAQPEKRNDWVLTPHPGEAARLLRIDTAQLQGDRCTAARALFDLYGGAIILKGAGTLIADGGETLHLCTAGNPGMAAPGMGDALTGIVAAFFGQTRDLASSARLAVWVHAQAGDLAAARGQRGMLTRDLIAELRACVNLGSN